MLPLEGFFANNYLYLFQNGCLCWCMLPLGVCVGARMYGLCIKSYMWIEFTLNKLISYNYVKLM